MFQYSFLGQQCVGSSLWPQPPVPVEAGGGEVEAAGLLGPGLGPPTTRALDGCHPQEVGVLLLPSALRAAVTGGAVPDARESLPPTSRGWLLNSIYLDEGPRRLPRPRQELWRRGRPLAHHISIGDCGMHLLLHSTQQTAAHQAPTSPPTLWQGATAPCICSGPPRGPAQPPRPWTPATTKTAAPQRELGHISAGSSSPRLLGRRRQRPGVLDPAGCVRGDSNLPTLDSCL